jgi:hypothetical protein
VLGGASSTYFIRDSLCGLRYVKFCSYPCFIVFPDSLCCNSEFFLRCKANAFFLSFFVISSCGGVFGGVFPVLSGCRKPQVLSIQYRINLYRYCSVIAALFGDDHFCVGLSLLAHHNSIYRGLSIMYLRDVNALVFTAPRC